ncbi:ROK family protein [Anaerolineales bacterium]
MTKEFIVGVDLGGTRVRAGLFDSQLNLIRRHEILTLAHEGLESTLKRICGLIETIIPEDRKSVLGIGFSAPGPLDTEAGVIVRPPNLHGWHNVPLAALISEEFSVPVFLGNDANLAALAETAMGAGKGYSHVTYITVSTGIGSGMIINGRMLLGIHGLAAEIGHIPLVVKSKKVSTPELEASGTAIARKAQKKLRKGAASTLLSTAGGDISAVNAKMVGDAANRGDALALEIIQEAGHVLGLTVVTVLHLFNPQMVLIGGGVSEIGDILFNPMWEAIRKYSMDEVYWRNLIIGQPALGEDVSLYGAAALVLTGGGNHNLLELNLSSLL